METKNMLNGIVSLTVVVICVAVIMMPVLSDATKTTETLTNDGIFRMEHITDESEDVTITWEYATPFTFMIGDNQVDMPQTNTTIPYSILCSEDWMLRYRTWSNGAGYELALFGGASSALWTVNSSSPSNATITLSAGTASFVKGTSDAVTTSYTELYCLDDTGDYVMKDSSETAYMLEDSPIYITGRSDATVNGNSVGSVFHLEGTIEDGVTATVIYPPSGLSTTNLQIVKTDADGYVGLYDFEKITLDATDGTDTTSLTYGQVIIPYEVTAELAQHLSAGEIAIIGAIPVMFIVAIVLMSVGLIVSRRD